MLLIRKLQDACTGHQPAAPSLFAGSVSTIGRLVLTSNGPRYNLYRYEDAGVSCRILRLLLARLAFKLVAHTSQKEEEGKTDIVGCG